MGAATLPDSGHAGGVRNCPFPLLPASERESHHLVSLAAHRAPGDFRRALLLDHAAGGLLDNIWGLIILNATFNMTFPIIILTQMFREVPIELEEAAQVDGASRWEMFFRISLPLVAPGLVVAWMLALAFSWNEFLFAFSSTVQSRPLSVAIVGAEQTRGVDYQFVGTRTLWAMIVPLIAALLAQRYIVRGLSLGAVKG